MEYTSDEGEQHGDAIVSESVYTIPDSSLDEAYILQLLRELLDKARERSTALAEAEQNGFESNDSKE